MLSSRTDSYPESPTTASNNSQSYRSGHRTSDTYPIETSTGRSRTTSAYASESISIESDDSTTTEFYPKNTKESKLPQNKIISKESDARKTETSDLYSSELTATDTFPNDSNLSDVNPRKRGYKIQLQEEGGYPEKRWSWTSLLKCVLFLYIILLLIVIIWFLLNSRKLLCPRSRRILFIAILLLIYGILLACSRTVRCISVLVLPILCSDRGRSLIVAAAFLIAATGPTVNIFRNLDVLMESMNCGQEQLKGAVEKMLDLVKAPFSAVKEAIQIAMREIKKIVKEVQVVLVKMRDVITDILESIKRAFDWLASIVTICNKELGTPFDRCMKIADNAMQDCKDYMGSFSGLCHVTHIFRGLCYSVKFIDVICLLVDYISDSIVAKVTERLAQFTADMKTMFYVSIKFDHDYEFNTTATKNLSTVGIEILAEVRKEFGHFWIIFGWLEIMGSFMLFFVILRAFIYRSKYLANDRFDNHFINKNFIEIDAQRKKMGKDTVLPLSRKERNKYVMINSWSLVRAEILKIARTILFLIVSTIQLFCICMMDYFLYWLLSMIWYYGHKEAEVDVPPFITVNISGNGFVTDIVKGIVHAFEPLQENYHIDPQLCLPNPVIPKFRKYWEIGGLMILAWIFLFCQPYILRLRQVVMGLFYPDRAKERALWLYTEILLYRTSFIKFARRQARQKFLKDKSAEAFSCLNFMRVKTRRFWICRVVLGAGQLDSCNICASPVKGDEDVVRCQQVGCKGTYCKECYQEMNNTCCLCQKPIDYGDISDVSEEKDSSDEFEGVKISDTGGRCSD